MSELRTPACPDCNDVDRRAFLSTMGGAAAVAGLGTVLPANLRADDPAAKTPPPARQPKPAEAMIKELFSGLTDQQKRQVCYDWDHKQANNQTPTRLRMFNAPIGTRIADGYTPAQRELCENIFKAITSGDEGYRLLSREGTWDGSRSFQACGAYIFGDPSGDRPYAWVFTGHHLTVRCDGNSEPSAAFGGPMYYGHSPDGHSRRNAFHYQTRAVQTVFEALNEQQRRQAVVVGNPGEMEGSIRHRAQGFPGIRSGDLSAAQKQLIEGVMRDVLSPYRREDADEVMDLVRRNGGMDRLHLAFYKDREAEDGTLWSFWRLEGPGFVWNYRVLPHVHTYVHIRGVAQS